MKYHDTDIQAVLATLEKYKLTKPVSEADQRKMLKTKTRLYKNILKTLGLYGLLNSLVTSWYFYVKKAGIKMIIVKTAAAIIATAAISGGIYYLVTVKKSAPAQGTQQNTVSITTEKPKPVIKKETKVPIITYTIAINKISTTSVNNKITGMVTSSLLNALRSQKGKRYASYHNAPGGRYRFTLLASVEQMDGVYFIYAKVVDRKTSSIVHVAKSQFKTETDLSKACKSLARSISNTIQ